MRKVIFSILIFGILLPAVFPLFQPLVPGTADGLAHKFRLVSFGKAVEQGVWKPRWIADQALGYGSPIFLFNYLLPYYAVWIITKLGFSINLSTQLYESITLLISFAGMYLLAERLWGKRAGMVAAIIYLYAPYHLMSVYLYEGWGEMTAFAWVPFILYFAIQVVDESFTSNEKIRNYKKLIYLYTFLPFLTRNSLLLIIFWSFLIISHNVSAFMLTPAVLLLTFLYARANVSRFLPVFKSFLAAVSLTAFFWLPAITLNGYTSYPSLIAAEIAMRGSFFKSLGTLGGNAFTTIQKGSVGYYDFTIGLSLFIVFVIGILLILLVVLYIICGSPFVASLLRASAGSERSEKSPANYWIIGLFLLFFLSLYLANYSSNWLWNIPFLHFIVYPFRFLFLTTVLGSILAGWVFRKSFIASIAIIVLALLAGRPFTHPVIDYFPFGDSYFHQVNTILFAPGTQKNMAILEFLPAWADKNFLLLQEKQYNATGKLPEKFEFTSGGGKVIESKLRPESISGTFDIRQDARIALSTFYFPNWEGRLDGKVIPVSYDTYGRMELKIPAGIHTFVLHFGLLTIEKLAWIVTLFSLTLIIFTTSAMIINRK